MQTTLLGLGIAIILALVAALVGPHFVDWNRYRSVFEANASRLVGIQVRVAGQIDVRLLPTPLVVLRGIQAVSPRGQPLMKADELGVELALGPLMRGEWRAAEMRVAKPDFALVLDAKGQLDWPGGAPALDPNALAIERLTVTDGRAELIDVASGSHRVIEGLSFTGGVRSLVGPYRGEGGFTADGSRVGYRLSTGRLGDDGIRVKLSLDPDRPFVVDTDGMLRFENGSPRFEGPLTLARRAAPADAAASGDQWRTTARVKATPANVLFDAIEFQYGPEDRAIKLTGTAEIRLGAAPQLDGVVSARNVDIDKLLGLSETTRRLPLAVARGIADLFGDAPRLPFPIRVGIGIDNVAFAGAALQNLRGDLRSDGGNSWDVQTLEVRAPGFAQVRATGRLALGGTGMSFTGPVSVEAGDPKALLAWLEGRDPVPAVATPLRASGDVTLGTDKVAVDRLKAEFERKAISGRLAYDYAAGGRPPWLDAEITAPDLDIDGALAFMRAAFGGTKVEMPGEVTLALDLGVATMAGIEAKGAKAKLKLDADALTLERVAIADLGGSAVDLTGRIDGLTTSPRGTVTFDLDARAFDGVTAVLSRYAPEAADHFRRVAPRLLPAKLHATLAVEPRASGAAGDKAKLSVSGRAGGTRVSIAADASGDPAKPALADFTINGRMESEHGAALATLLGIDQAIGIDQSLGALNLVAAGRLAGDVRLDGWLRLGGLNLAAKGTLRPSALDNMGSLDVSLTAADMRLPRVVGQTGRSVPVTIDTRLAITSDTISLDNLKGTVAGSPIRGRLVVSPGDTMRIDGVLDAESIDAMALVGGAAGASANTPNDARAWSTEAFRRGTFADIVGKIELSVGSARFAPTLVAQPLRGAMRFIGDETRFENMQGMVAGGRLSGTLVLRNGAEGLVMRTNLELADASLAALIPVTGRPVTGRATLKLEAEGNGLSPAALIGALRGTGTVSLEQSQFAGLDPRAFPTVISAVDQAPKLDAIQIKDLVAAGLDMGRLIVPRADAGFTIAAGQVRWGNVVAAGDGADLAVGGSFDLSEWLLDARIILTGPADDRQPTLRPDIFVQLRGPPLAPQRNVDVSALSSWLMLRAVERESRRLEALQATPGDAPAAAPELPPAAPAARTGLSEETPEIPPPPRRPVSAPRAPGPRSAAVPPSTAPQAAPDLPAPIEIRPVPGQGTSGIAPRKPMGKSGTNAAPAPNALPANIAPRSPNTVVARPPADVPLGRSLLDPLFGPQR